MSELDQNAIRQLAARAQVLGLPAKTHLDSTTRTVLREADQQRRLLTTNELSNLCHTSGVILGPLQQLQQQANQLVDEARRQLLQAQPELVQPGGALYPEQRAEACWRDCFHFLRVCCYSVASGEPEFTDPEGMTALGELYHVLGVPVAGLLLALSSLHQLACRAYAVSAPEADVKLLDQAFGELQSKIRACVVTSC